MLENISFILKSVKLKIRELTYRPKSVTDKVFQVRAETIRIRKFLEML